MTEDAVSFEKVIKKFGAVQALEEQNFTIAKGELVSMLGPSGCGKTTTLRLIAGLEMPTAGRIVIGGRDVSNVPTNLRSIGMVFQSYALFPHLNILENVAYGLIAKQTPKKQALVRAMAQLEQLGLAEKTYKLPAELSGGQQQRAALARALVLEPDVLLFDEPLSNLDAKLRRQVRDEIRDLQQALGLSVVYVTHDQTEALAISDRIFLMRNGRIEQSGSPRELYDAPRSEFVADFMGDANVLKVKAGADGHVRFGSIPVPGSLAPGAEAILVARPELLAIAREGQEGLPGRVARASYLGGVMEYRVETELGTLLIADRNVREPVRGGSDVHVLAAPEDLRLIPQTTLSI
ncbi:MAG: ABC transporter ATP-binding protein [Mesorhizobium sp.]|nr:ABC transporter ATP-binding protein [Mesorhizobium sp.]MBL8580373.1 ABC transporter ATP-binding protein [Mesorhizobium sp.]